MFRPNKFGLLQRRTGYNGFGEPLFSPQVRVRCAVVSLNLNTAKTSVRTDSSATRGNAEEDTSTAKILFPIDVRIGKEMKFEIAGQQFRVMDVQPRFAVNGRHDHDECMLTVWVDEGSL